MSRQSTRNSTSGLTIIELMLAMTLGLMISAVALTLTVSGKSLYQADASRTGLNHNMRAAMDFLVTDVRQAGERLGDDFAALLLNSGSGNSPDELVIRRNLLSTVLRVCSDTSGTDDVIAIAQASSPPQGCAVVPDDDSDGWPENLQAWREYRLAGGGSVRAYIYNPVTKQGEFFDLVGEDVGTTSISAPSGINWSFNYPVADLCRLYMLEERRYTLSGGRLQIVVNDVTTSPLNVVSHVDGFQAVAVFQDFSQQNTLDTSDVWSDLRSIQIELSGSVVNDGETIERTWTNEIMPRNVLSR